MSPAITGIRVLSWNVHSCIGRTGRFDPEGVADCIRRLDPDVVALQEVDTRPAMSDDFDTFAYLRSCFDGAAAVEARTIRAEQGDYGHLLMSRWAIDEVRQLDLTVPGREPRTAISCVLRDTGVRVIAAHLGLRAGERRRQLDACNRDGQ